MERLPVSDTLSEVGVKVSDVSRGRPEPAHNVFVALSSDFGHFLGQDQFSSVISLQASIPSLSPHRVQGLAYDR